MVGKDRVAGADPRVIRSRAAILEAATRLFLRAGYGGTTMDDIAEAAGVSKRTIYNNFADKEAVFREVVLTATGIAEQFAAEAARALSEPDDLPAALVSVARRLAADATSPEVVRLRRLLVGEAHRFPDLAAEYYRLAPGRVISTTTRAFESLGRQGRLRIDDAPTAAEHFAFLVIGASLDRAMFDGRDRRPEPGALKHAADEGVHIFLAAYGHADPSSRTSAFAARTLGGPTIR